MTIVYLSTVIDAIYTFMRAVADFVLYEIPDWVVFVIRSAGDGFNTIMSALTWDWWNSVRFTESWHEFCDLLAEHPLGIAILLGSGALLIVVIILRVLKTLWDAVPVL